MRKTIINAILRTGIICFLAGWTVSCTNKRADRSKKSQADLVTLYHDWRSFHADLFTDGVPDYGVARMKKQFVKLSAYRERLAQIDTTGWSVPHRIDYHLVQAEMNGLDFDHRILKPWERNPGFYALVWDYQSDTPAHEGPTPHGLIELWQYDYPLSGADADKLAKALQTVPPFLAQAEGNLTGDARDLWRAGIYRMKSQSRALGAQLEKTEETADELTSAINEAKGATDDFIAWLESELPSKQSPSGIGIEHYDWYLKNVHLIPFTWEEIETMMRRELARSHSSLKLEEHRNRDLPPLVPMATGEEYDRRTHSAITEYVSLLDERDIVSMQDYMDQALRERIRPYSPKEPREFFSEIIYHDPMIMLTHFYHWFDLARMRDDPHTSPVRSNPLLYNIWDSRSEGLATGFEEMMMHAGLFDDHPRARELFHILLAQRAARALGDLYVQVNRWNIDEAVEFTSKWTPRNWLRRDGRTVIGEQYLYLQQPSYGTSYVVGKIQIESLMAEMAVWMGDDFSIQRFMDGINSVGLVPMSMVRWELTGDSDHLSGLDE